MTDTIEFEQRIVERYTRMTDASARMLVAARANDWDAVCEAEKECAALIAELRTMGDLSPRDPQIRQEKMRLMRQVLADDAQIRNLSQPWLNKLDAILRAPHTAARLNRVYDVGAQSA